MDEELEQEDLGGEEEAEPGEGGERQERQVELETGPLLPRWLSVPAYAVLLAWCAFTCWWIGRSMVIQHRIVSGLSLIDGPWEGEMPPMDSPLVADHVKLLESKPRDSLLYVVQELRQDAIKDVRMSTAISLRKAMRWGIESNRRKLFDALLAEMDEKGELPGDYKLPAEHEATLLEFVKERTDHPSESYEEHKITEALQWIADGCPTPAKGPERRRIKALKTNYAKKVFFGAEGRSLTRVMEEWQQSGEALRKSAAEKFALMLEGKHVELTPEEQEFCGQRAAHWKGLYLAGQRRLAQVALAMVKILSDDDGAGEEIPYGKRLDHPHLWDLVRLLDLPDTETREYFSQAVFAMRHRKFTFIFLREFILRDTINPVMAVETARLSKAEHEDELKEEQLRRRLASLEAVRRISAAYCAQQFEIRRIAPFHTQRMTAKDQEKFFRERVIGTLEAVQEDKNKKVRDAAARILEEIRAAAPQYFD